jgi:hypothetical protein
MREPLRISAQVAANSVAQSGGDMCKGCGDKGLRSRSMSSRCDMCSKSVICEQGCGVICEQGLVIGCALSR